MKTFVGVILLGSGLLLAGCGEQLSGQTQKAVEQIKGEASKLASKQIETFKTDTVEQLKKLQGASEKEKSAEKPDKKPSDSADK
jgi:outer membrane murein-binding lipoprotein Lpp